MIIPKFSDHAIFNQIFIDFYDASPFAESLEVPIGADRGDFEDAVFLGVEASHFEVDPEDGGFFRLHSYILTQNRR